MNKEYAEGNYLGIDWGRHDVGIALAHAETRIAVSLQTECNDAGLIERIGQVIENEAIHTVVIGVPSYASRKGVRHPSEELGRLLIDRYGVTIVYQDEMFTTKLAQQSLIQRGERHVGEKDDAEAAKIILQQWLDKKL